MKHGIVPSSWMAITNTWSASELLTLLEAVNAQGVDHYDLAAVRRVWEQLKEKP
jgi:hypothetical protein